MLLVLEVPVYSSPHCIYKDAESLYQALAFLKLLIALSPATSQTAELQD